MELSAASPVFELTDVIRVYRDAEVETIALRGIDLTVQTGEFVAVTGRSGSGKSTLLGLMAAVDRPTAGRVGYRGVDLGHLDEQLRSTLRGSEIGIVFQAQNLFSLLTLRENVELSARLAGRHPTRDEVIGQLAAVGLEDRADHHANALSGGEQQRGALACILAARPRVLLGDEITGELDTHSADEVLRAVTRLREDTGMTVILVTHDGDVAARADRVVELHDGRVAGGRAIQ
ncbi:MAG: ABC transporter ATP-binding protein [Candidatus Limnocylindria bacterium]